MPDTYLLYGSLLFDYVDYFLQRNAFANGLEIFSLHCSFLSNLTWQQKRECEYYLYTQPARACEIPRCFCLIEDFFLFV